MYHVDNETAVAVMPTIGAVKYTDPHWFTAGDATNKPTYPGPDWFNVTQAELLNVLGAAEIAPKKDDNTQLAQAIAKLISAAVTAAQVVPDIGELYITKGATDPNEKYPNTTWVRVAAGVSLRSAKTDGTDAGGTVGADTVTIATANLPVHAHNIGGATGSGGSASVTSSAYDFASLSTNNTGAHTHTYTFYQYDTSADNDSDGAAGAPTTQTGTTSSSGAHAHTVDMPSHSHTVAVPAHTHTLPAATQNAGSGTALSVIPHSLIVNIWERTA